jgi:hypothetical protein
MHALVMHIYRNYDFYELRGCLIFHSFQSNSTGSTMTSSPMDATATLPLSSKFRWDVFLSFRGADTRKNFCDDREIK